IDRGDRQGQREAIDGVEEAEGAVEVRGVSRVSVGHVAVDHTRVSPRHSYGPRARGSTGAYAVRVRGGPRVFHRGAIGATLVLVTTDSMGPWGDDPWDDDELDALLEDWAEVDRTAAAIL